MQLDINDIFQYSNKSVKQVVEVMWEIYLPTKQIWDRRNIKPINLAIFQNYQHQPRLFSLLIAEKNSNEKKSTKLKNHLRIQWKRNTSERQFPLSYPDRHNSERSFWPLDLYWDSVTTDLGEAFKILEILASFQGYYAGSQFSLPN